MLYVLDAVFDSGTDSSSPTFSSTGEDTEELQMPARPRTTDDLFAAIHRYPKSYIVFFYYKNDLDTALGYAFLMGFELHRLANNC